ncbi:glucuronoxylan 4-O-methyltransferase 1 [Selaginella moellendorffii]|uniref:Glucuronoxylan methyltransferase n=2 Tax=Selaginella moellendorffii TaxID=88036 RepID=A0A1B1IJK7_SELML|nr:glucuronoxylan 4-O-methyltransferase 1 [Selaginella moellendorffii]ANR94922.1 glucuronoxylan methyltransferase [Selaginella moellendorffii]|eukprot:XP_002978695.2 glucuronoxylan 4-O-methyltransferase 1 [Selaginella moellendorffii]
MALFPSPNPKNKPSWKLLPILILVVFSLAFLLFRDASNPSQSLASSSSSSSSSSPSSQIVLVPVKNTISVPMTVERLPHDLMTALVHYASTDTTPQQTREEILMTAKVLASRGPCNFLVFGLGHDSLLWKMLNYAGRTVFLEESEDWIRQISEKHPELETHIVEYSTVLTEADQLLEHARSNRKGKCTAVQNLLLSECKLALNGLADELFQVEWDVIMVDAPRGYFPGAPGRMAAIFSAAVMARSRKTGNGTDVFVHDVERPVERSYSEEFLCRENLVEESVTSHLWHFRVLPSPVGRHEFCVASSSSGGSPAN